MHKHEVKRLIDLHVQSEDVKIGRYGSEDIEDCDKAGQGEGSEQGLKGELQSPWLQSLKNSGTAFAVFRTENDAELFMDAWQKAQPQPQFKGCNIDVRCALAEP